MVLWLRGWGLEWAFAGGSDPEKMDLEKEPERGRAKGKVGYCWVAAMLWGLLEWAESCAEQGGRVYHAGLWQWVAVGHLMVH